MKYCKQAWILALLIIQSSGTLKSQCFLKTNSIALDVPRVDFSKTWDVDENHPLSKKDPAFFEFFVNLKNYLKYGGFDMDLRYDLYENPQEQNVFVQIEESGAIIYFEANFFKREDDGSARELWEKISATLHEVGHVLLKKYTKYENPTLKYSELQADFIGATLFDLGSYSEIIAQHSNGQVTPTDYFSVIGDDNQFDFFHHGSPGERQFMHRLSNFFPNRFFIEFDKETFLNLRKLTQISYEISTRFQKVAESDDYSKINPQIPHDVEAFQQDLIDYCYKRVENYCLDLIKEKEEKYDDISRIQTFGDKVSLLYLKRERLNYYWPNKSTHVFEDQMFSESRNLYEEVKDMPTQGEYGKVRSNISGHIMAALAGTKNWAFGKEIHESECLSNKMHPCEYNSEILAEYQYTIGFDTIYRKYKNWLPLKPTKEQKAEKYKYFLEQYKSIDNSDRLKFQLGVLLSTDIAINQSIDVAWKLILENEELINEFLNQSKDVRGEIFVRLFYAIKARTSTRKESFKFSEYLNMVEKACSTSRAQCASEGVQYYYPSTYYVSELTGSISTSRRAELNKYLEYLEQEEFRLERSQKPKAMLEQAYIYVLLGYKQKANEKLENALSIAEVNRIEIIRHINQVRELLTP